MSAAPFPNTRRTGVPSLGWRIAAACSSSPFSPTAAALPKLSADGPSIPRAATARCVSNSPSSSPIVINSERSSTYFPAQGFSITATAAARRAGGSTARPISVRVSSTKMAILRIFAFMLLSCRPSSQPVLSLDLRRFQAADAGMYPCSGGHHQREQNFVGLRSISNTDLHCIEMTSYVRGVDMGDGNVETSSRTADFFSRRDDRLCSAEHVTHGIAAGNVPERAVFKLSGRAHNRALAVTLNQFRVATQRCYQ